MNLNQVTVPTLDVSRSIDFYRKLGLKLIVHTGPHYARFLCPEGDSTFSVHCVDELPKGEGIVVYFEVEKLDVVCKQLQNNGVYFHELPKDKGWLWKEAELFDPDGNKIILFHGGVNRKNPPWLYEGE